MAVRLMHVPLAAVEEETRELGLADADAVAVDVVPFGELIADWAPSSAALVTRPRSSRKTAWRNTENMLPQHCSPARLIFGEKRRETSAYAGRAVIIRNAPGRSCHLLLTSR